MQSWNVCGEYETIFTRDKGQWSFDDERPCPLELVQFMAPLVHDSVCMYPDANEYMVFTLRIPFRSQGYYDGGVSWGPPEHCYPPEGEDERTLNGLANVELHGTVATTELSKELSEKLFDLFLKEIEDIQIEPEPPDMED